jgi:rod shape-determining protein MreB
MLNQIFSGIIDSDLYVQVWENHLKVICIKSNAEFSEPPFIAIEKNGKAIVKAVGTEAKLLLNNPAYEVTNPFSHPRQLLANFQKGEKIIQHAVRRVLGKKLFSPSPRIVFQPMEKTEGGLTEVEVRAFKELCLGAGAREVVVYLGAPLSRQTFNYTEAKAQGL